MKIFFLLLLVATAGFAEDFTFNKDKGQAVPNYVAQLKDFTGKVYKITKGKKTMVEKGMRFYQADAIETDEKSFAKLLIVDDSILTISARSELKFENFNFTDKTDRQIVYNFIKGQIRALVKNKAKEGDLIIKTKHAAMAVRGTEFLVNHQSVKTLDIAEFALLEGNVIVTDSANQKHELNKSERVVIVNESSSKKTANIKNKLSDAEFKGLEGVDTSFLPYFDPTTITKESPLFSLLDQAADAPSSESDDSAERSKSKGKKDWRENLKKLNEQLKENQKKKGL